jgi:hypothetical protein
MCYSDKTFVLQETIVAKPVRTAKRGGSKFGSQKFRDVLTMAKHEGLLRGGRTKIIRGRMPEALVSEAKKRSGIKSDTDLIEVALANIAVSDNYAEWLLSRSGSIDPEVDLEY